MTAKTVIAPMVHLNGSGQERLCALLRDQVDAIHAAIEYMMIATPHDRDYYPLERSCGLDIGHKARMQHHARIAALEAVRDELLAIWGAINDGRSGEIGVEP